MFERLKRLNLKVVALNNLHIVYTYANGVPPTY